MDLSRTQWPVKARLDPVRPLEEFPGSVSGEPGPAEGRGRVSGVRGPRHEGKPDVRPGWSRSSSRQPQFVDLREPGLEAGRLPAGSGLAGAVLRETSWPGQAGGHVGRPGGRRRSSARGAGNGGRSDWPGGGSDGDDVAGQADCRHSGPQVVLQDEPLLEVRH